MAKQYTLTTIKSPIGDITIMHANNVIHICEFADRQKRVVQHIRQHYTGQLITPGPLNDTIQHAFKVYFDGTPTALEHLNACPKGSEFECKVWEKLREIPAGSTVNYGSIAADLNSSARAVGRANGKNPTSLIIPCHRVIGADGSLTGYAGGLPRKEWLLKHEEALLNL